MILAWNASCSCVAYLRSAAVVVLIGIRSPNHCASLSVNWYGGLVNVVYLALLRHERPYNLPSLLHLLVDIRPTKLTSTTMCLATVSPLSISRKSSKPSNKCD